MEKELTKNEVRRSSAISLAIGCFAGAYPAQVDSILGAAYRFDRFIATGEIHIETTEPQAIKD